MKKFDSSRMFKKIILFFFLLFFILFPLVLFFWWNQVSKPINKDSKQSVIIVIPQGLGVEEIGKVLKNKGLIKSTLAFRLLVMKENVSQSLQAGDYSLSFSMSLSEIVKNLTHGTLDIWVTIPEGLRREEIAVLLKQAFLEKEIDFSQEEFIEQTANLEGFLFPDTYLIPKTTSILGIIKILTANFEQKFASLNIETGLTREQTIILASLVEREAKYDKDRKLVAGILLKRLKKGWPLQVDATIQYVQGGLRCSSQAKSSCQWWAPVNIQDLKLSSSYNTYEQQGLPPTSICNPGFNSLEAAANPVDSEYWFYLSDNSGKTYYAVTNEEHNENIRNYLD